MWKLAMLLLWCLIAFIPKVDFEKNPEAYLEALKQIYFENHKGFETANFTVGENSLGQIVIIIDQPKVEI